MNGERVTEGHENPGADEIEWYDDGLGFVSWRRGWPEFLGPRHVALAVVLGLAGGAGLWLAGLGAVVALTGAWFGALCVLLLLSDALGRILPDRYVLLATGGVLLGWALDAALRRDLMVLVGPLVWAAVTCAAFLALMVFSLLLSRGASEGLGAGDVKVVVPLALWLGRWGGGAVLAGLVLGVLLAGVWVVLRLVTRRMGRGGTIAFGPWLVAGAVVTTAAVAALVAHAR